MLFREEILGCSTDCGTSLQINGWITSAKSNDAVRFLHLIQTDCQTAILEWDKDLMSSPYSLLCSMEGSFVFSYWNAERQRGILFKSLLCKQSLYYTDDKVVSWSTDPLQIISRNYVDAVENTYLLIACLEDSIPVTSSYYSDLKRLPAGNLAVIDSHTINRKTIDVLTPCPSI